MEKAVKPAVGIWLFSIDAFRAYAKDGEPVLGPRG